MEQQTEQIAELSPTKRALLALKELQAKLDRLEQASQEPIAVIGMGCRFPGHSDTPAAFWQLLHNGTDAIIEAPAERWTPIAAPESDQQARMQYGGFIQQYDTFDPAFFRISPREAASLDPHQRLVLEVSWEALEYAGLAPDALFGSAAGVFIGVTNFDHSNALLKHGDPQQRDVYFVSGSALNMSAGRLSYLLGITGPSMVIDTACSSSLVAVHLACQSLRNRECDAAFAGGVNILSTPEVSRQLAGAGMLAPNGRCKTFDAAADGYTRGEGCGMIILKRLSDARADGDTILALVRGSAVNQDGPTGGLTVPSGPAQEKVIRRALANGGLRPTDVQYIEAHGTGTSLGDPIEIGALGNVFGPDRPQDQPLIVGSVKTNIGHLESAAGIAGILKVIMSMQHGIIPPHLHFQTPSPHIPWQTLPLAVPTHAMRWDAGEKPCVAGVSSFGFSGTNAHIVLEQAPTPPASGGARPWHLLTFSAKTDTALERMTARMAAHLKADPDSCLADIAYTGQVGRSAFDQRCMLVCQDQRDALAVLESGDPARLIRGQSTRQPPQIVFMFPGQGAQHVRMTAGLYEHEPVFRQQIDLCASLLTPMLGLDLRELIYPVPDKEQEAAEHLAQTSLTQPALFAIEYALAQLWMSWGVQPTAMIGHSVGEYVAACLADVLSLEAALSLVVARGRLMQDLPPGAMLAVPLAEDAIRPLLEPCLAVAAVNGPARSVVSGPVEAVQALEQQLTAQGISCRPVRTSHAFHSSMMDPITAAFNQRVRHVQLNAPRIRYLSNVTGSWISDDQATDPAYWERHLRDTVRFADGLDVLNDGVDRVLLEVGPGQTLSSLARQYAQHERAPQWHILPSLPHWQDRQSELPLLLGTLGKLWLAEVEIDWPAVYANQQRRRVVLPTYPFERTRHWVGQANIPMDGAMTTTVQNIDMETQQIERRHSQLTVALRSIIASVLQTRPEQIAGHIPFLELGADSIVLLEAIRKLEQTFGVTLAIRQLFEEQSTLDSLAIYLKQHVAPDWYAAQVQPVAAPPEPGVPAGQPTTAPASLLPGSSQPAIAPTATNGVVAHSLTSDTPASSLVERVLHEQIQAMSRLMSEQINMLRGVATDSAGPQLADATQAVVQPVAQPPAPAPQPTTKSTTASPEFALGKAAGIQSKTKTLTPQQQRYLESFAARYNQRTRGSKEFTRTHRPAWADIRSTMGFRAETKELCYTLVADRSSGSRMWDIDGNPYIDVAMGFGVHLFGHNPPFISAAVEEQLRKGTHIGPQSDLVGEVSNLITELTGLERVTYCNSGTEAVMSAIRLARAATGRTKIVFFSDAYHGHSDHTLAIARMINGTRQSVPWVPGVPMSVTGEVIVLPYGEPESLEIIQQHLPDLAGVLVEMVQSRRPNLQPTAFLRQLRQMTAQADVPLILDEVITGFRILPGGGQAWFGIQADIATYGKILGGGMPIGVVAGTARYMDQIDGGQWAYGDDSFPAVTTTFTAGTFCKHPLTMAAAHAALTRIKEAGPSLYQQLNQRTTRMAETLNAYFLNEGLSISVAHFGSIFRLTQGNNFSYLYQPLEMDLLYYQLLYRGVYQWEGRTCFLSTEHTDADVDEIIRAVQASIADLREGGFLADVALQSNNGSSSPPAGTNGAGKPTETTRDTSATPQIVQSFPATKPQRQLWAQSQFGDDGQIASKVSAALEMRGPLNMAALQESLQAIVDRHETLRSTFNSQGDLLQVWSAQHQELPLVDLMELEPAERADRLAAWFEAESRRGFDFAAGPLFRTTLIRMEPQFHILVWATHHIVVDGWSVMIILRELGALYRQACGGAPADLQPPFQFREYVAWQLAQLDTPAMSASATYWRQQFDGSIPTLNLPTDHPRPRIKTYTGSRLTRRYDPPFGQTIKQASQANGATTFMLLFAVYSVLLHQISGQDDLIVGVPVGGRALDQGDTIVGYCTHVLPIRSRMSAAPTFMDYFKDFRKTLLTAYEHQDYPFAELLEQLNLRRDPGASPLVAAIFNIEPRIPVQRAFDLDIDLITPAISYTAYDIDLNITEIGDEYVLDLDHNSDLFEKATIERFMDDYEALLREFIRDPHQDIASAYRELREKADKQAQQSAREQFKKLRQERARRTGPLLT